MFVRITATDSSAGSAIKHLLALVENVRDMLQQQGGMLYIPFS